MDFSDNGIYIHVPFCASKCPYCDFYSVSPKNGTREYTDAVINELKTLSRSSGFVPDEFRSGKFTSLYIGGGTPSVLSREELTDIIKTAKSCYDFTPDAEITVECNPSSPALEEKLKAMAQAGVNRISFGMQSGVDEERKSLGRKAGQDGIKKAVEMTASSGITNISLDVMLGVPGQTEDSLKATTDFVLSLDVPHISAYMLKLEEGTFFYKNADRLNLPDEDETADLYLRLCNEMKKAGYRHYEISNFCRDGLIGRHNMKYWTLKPYLGIGPAAHSFIGGKRFYYPRNLDDFIEKKPPLYDGEGGDEEEELMLGLRTDTGIVLPEKAEALGRQLIKNGLAATDGERFHLTDEGMLISNTIICNILSETGL